MANVSSSNSQKALVPKLRFPGFEGEWNEISFESLFEILPNNTLSRADLSSDGEILNIHYGDVLIKFGDVLDFNTAEIPFIAAPENLGSKTRYLRDGDIVIADTAEDETVGKTTEMQRIGTRKVVAGLHTIPCRPLERFAEGYLGYYTNAPAFHNQLYSLMQGIKVLSISKSNINKTNIRFPIFDEQKKISEMLLLLDGRIEVQRRLVEALKSYKRGALSKLFPKKGASEPEVRLSGFTGEWEQRKFQETVIIERGGSPRPIENFITEAENGLNWVKIGDAPAMGNYITKTAEKIRPEGLHYTREVHPGDLILSNSMSFGKPYIMGINGCIHDGWLLIRNENDTYDLDFLCHLLGAKHMLDQYKSLAAGSAVNNLNKELVGSTIVSYPGIQEQKAIGNLLTSLDSLIALHQKNVVTYEKVKHGLIQELFI